jgi:predicted SAM-dependent methyltransferase
MLYVAPMRELETKFKWIRGLDCLTADLNDPKAMVKMDITNIQYPDNSFDIIICSHVLEHVSEDRKAISELRRVLKSDGWLTLMVPITVEKTFEDPSVTDSAERERLFGQHDHVRKYGPDIHKRLEECGFVTKVYHLCDLFNDKEILRLGLKYIDQKKIPIYYCKK